MWMIAARIARTAWAILRMVLVAIRGRVARIARASIWAHGNITRDQWRYRGILRLILPLSDALVVWWAFTNFFSRNAGLEKLVGHEFEHWWTLVVALSSLIAFVGIAFPKFWAVEILGRTTYVSAISGYLIYVLALSLTSPLATAGVALNTTLVLLAGWRVTDLGVEAWKRGSSK